MTSFVESCIGTVEESARSLERRTRGRPQARKLVKALAGKKHILVTTHLHPDPDALASAHAMAILLRSQLPAAEVVFSIRGHVAGGINEAFATHSGLDFVPWDETKLEGMVVESGIPASGVGGRGEKEGYDAIVLMDCQPAFAFNPVRRDVPIMAVVDHHRAKGRKPTCRYCDIRTDVGATSSIVFSYFMELEEAIPPLLAATLLYAIESDLAGAAGTPGELDNMALAGLTLMADTKALYKMRYVKLSQGYFEVFAESLATAMVYERAGTAGLNGGGAVVSHISKIDTLEKPAVIADTLLRLQGVEYALVTGVHDGRLVASLRAATGTSVTAADAMTRIMRGLGDGGGHRTKAGGAVPLAAGADAEAIGKIVAQVRKRFLGVLEMGKSKGRCLVPKVK